MRAFALRTLLLTGLVIATLAALGALGERVPRSIPAIARIEVGCEQTDLDVLFIGSSQTYSAVDTAWLSAQGLRSFNLGTPTAGPGFSAAVFDNYAAAAGAPPHVVFEVGSWTLSTGSDNWHRYPIHDHLQHVELDPRPPALGEYPVRLVERAQLAVTSLIDFAWRQDEVEREISRERARQLASRGFRPSEKVPGPLSKKRASRSAFSAEKARAFSDLIGRVRAAGSQVTLLEVPTLEVATRRDRARLAAELDRLEGSGVRVLRLDVEIPRDGWGDRSHMNARGAAVFTRALLDAVEDAAPLELRQREAAEGQ
jgi:hypothetical protein